MAKVTRLTPQTQQVVRVVYDGESKNFRRYRSINIMSDKSAPIVLIHVPKEMGNAVSFNIVIEAT